MFKLDFLRWFSLMGTTLCAAPSKSYAFSTNYYACIAQPTWCRCAPPILFWPWPVFNVFPRPCLTVDPHWQVWFCVHYPSKAVSLCSGYAGENKHDNSSVRLDHLFTTPATASLIVHLHIHNNTVSPIFIRIAGLRTPASDSGSGLPKSF